MTGNPVKPSSENMSIADEVTFLFASIEQRALDIVRLLDALPRLCRGALVECDLGTSSRSDHLVCVARLRGALSGDTRSRLEFWAWQAGGTASRGSRQGRVALRACDLVQPRVPNGALGSAVRELLGRHLVVSPDPTQERLPLRLSLTSGEVSGMVFEHRKHTLFIPSPRSLPLGEEMSLDFRLPDGEVVRAEGVVTRRRRAGEDGSGTPAGFVVALFESDRRLIAELETSAPGIPGLQERRAPRYPVRALARVAAEDDATSAGDAQACVENLSQSGAFVRTAAAVPAGTKVRLEVDLPGAPTAEVVGTAVHCNDRGIGVRFDTNQAGDAAIAAILEHATVHRRRALVVDDDALCRRMIADELGAQGFEVFSASDGAAGLSSLMDLLLGLDLFLVDLHMPELDGEKLLTLVREPGGERELTIVVMSGDSDPAMQERLAAAGADAVLPKSHGMAQIAEASVQVLLRREQLRIRAERCAEMLA